MPNVIEELEELKRKIIRYCYWYYVKAEPLISDYKFDMLFKYVESLERLVYHEAKDIPFDSPTQMIYGDGESQYPEWAKKT